MVGTVASASSSIVWLLLCFAAQILNYTQMLNRLPPDQQNTPFCGMLLHIFIFLSKKFFIKKKLSEELLLASLTKSC